MSNEITENQNKIQRLQVLIDEVERLLSKTPKEKLDLKTRLESAKMSATKAIDSKKKVLKALYEESIEELSEVAQNQTAVINRFS